MHIDSRFMDGKDLPKGQGTLSDLLAECYDQIRELRLAAIGKESEYAKGSADQS